MPYDPLLEEDMSGLIDSSIDLSAHMQIGKNKIVLSTGREIHCLGPNIGMSLTETPKGWRITTGFDDVIHTKADGSWHEDALSNAEAREIADYMIDVWTKYKDSVPD